MLIKISVYNLFYVLHTVSLYMNNLKKIFLFQYYILTNFIRYYDKKY